jgi:hypothetical protein
MNSTHVAIFDNDGLGGELSHLVLGAFGLFLRLRFLVPNRRVPVAWQYRAAFLLSTGGSADLRQLRLRGDSLRDMRL